MKKSILPRKKNKWWIPVFAAIILLLVGFLFIKAEVEQYQHQPLYIVNRLPVPAVVEIPGYELFNIIEESVVKTTISEGKYNVTVTIKDKKQEVPIHITNNLFDRVTDKNAFIFNVNGAAVLLWQKVVYSTFSYPGETLPYKYYTGESLVSLHDLDYVLEEYSKTLPVEVNNILIKKGVQCLDYPAEDLYQVLSSLKDIEDTNLLLFLEAHIPYNLGNERLLSDYYTKIIMTNQQERGMTFIYSFLKSLPVNIELHRIYQNFSSTKDQKIKLSGEYDRFIKENPGNSDFYYLRGRIENDYNKANHYYNKSLEIDKKNPHPWYAKAYQAYYVGDYKTAEEMSSHARNLAPSIERIIDLNIRSRFALGEYTDLEKELSLKVTENPFHMEYLLFLLQMDIASNKPEDAKKRLDLYKYQVNNQNGDDTYFLYSYAEMSYLYFVKDFDTYKEKALEISKKENGSTGYLFNVHLEEGEIALAESSAGEAGEVNGSSCLLLWLGWLEEGNREKAIFWLDRAKVQFKKGNEYEQSIAGLLSPEAPHIYSSVHDFIKYISLDPPVKRIIAAALARLYPGEQDALFALAKALNFDMNFPYYFLQGVCK